MATLFPIVGIKLVMVNASLASVENFGSHYNIEVSFLEIDDLGG